MPVLGAGSTLQKKHWQSQWHPATRCPKSEIQDPKSKIAHAPRGHWPRLYRVGATSPGWTPVGGERLRREITATCHRL